MTQTHELKTQWVHFQAIKRGDMYFKIHRNDQFFQKGDIVNLRCLSKNGANSYDSFEEILSFRIGSVLQGGQLGIEPGWCILSLLPLEEKHD